MRFRRRCGEIGASQAYWTSADTATEIDEDAVDRITKSIETVLWTIDTAIKSFFRSFSLFFPFFFFVYPAPEVTLLPLSLGFSVAGDGQGNQPGNPKVNSSSYRFCSCLLGMWRSSSSKRLGQRDRGQPPLPNMHAWYSAWCGAVLKSDCVCWHQLP